MNLAKAMRIAEEAMNRVDIDCDESHAHGPRCWAGDEKDMALLCLRREVLHLEASIAAFAADVAARKNL